MKSLLIAAALTLIAAPAFAQTATSDTQSNATAVSGSVASGGVSGATADNTGNAQSITFNSEAVDHVKTNPAVYAPGLTTTLTETCMGSTSGGISVLGFGGTLGTTWSDTQCVRRLNAREMAQTLGDREAARALLCQDENVAAAYAAVDQSCFLAVASVRVPVREEPPPPVTSAPPPLEPKPPATMQPIPNPPAPTPYKGERG